MATIADNIRSMAGLVADVKKDFKLTENTVLRIVDMNFALAQGAGVPSFGGDEEIVFAENNETDDIPQQLPLFPLDDEDIDESDEDTIATVEHPPLEN